jgi:hypothetical protein
MGVVSVSTAVHLSSLQRINLQYFDSGVQFLSDILLQLFELPHLSHCTIIFFSHTYIRPVRRICANKITGIYLFCL